jgi:hypothetical protein
MPTSLLDPNACRAALATLLQGISGVGRVHAYRRIARSDAEVVANFMQGGKINAWLIAFAANGPATSERHMGFSGIGVAGGGMVMTTFSFQIEGYFGLDEANDSEETFANLAWAIAQTINSYGALNIAGLVLQQPCDVALCTYAMLANKFLTHYARLTVAMQGRTQ